MSSSTSEPDHREVGPDERRPPELPRKPEANDVRHPHILFDFFGTLVEYSASRTEQGYARSHRLLVDGGPAAFSLRAIARDMGMTASAIYRYFPSLDALVSDLRTDLYTELSAPVDAARTEIPADRPAARLAAMAHAFRRWSIAHPAEFSLMFGETIPGVAVDDDTCCETPDGVLSFCKAFLAELVVLWQHNRFQTPPPEVISDRFAAQLSPYLRELSDEHPVDVVYAFLSGWIRLYGMVSMEVFGHLSWAVTDAEALFETEIAAFLHQLTSR